MELPNPGCTLRVMIELRSDPGGLMSFFPNFPRCESRAMRDNNQAPDAGGDNSPQFMGGGSPDPPVPPKFFGIRGLGAPNSRRPALAEGLYDSTDFFADGKCHMHPGSRDNLPPPQPVGPDPRTRGSWLTTWNSESTIRGNPHARWGRRQVCERSRRGR